MGVKRLATLLRESNSRRRQEQQAVVHYDAPGLAWGVESLMRQHPHKELNYPGMQDALLGFLREGLLNPARLDMCVVFLTDGGKGKAQALAKCATARERRKRWEKEDRTEERALRNGTFDLSLEIDCSEVERVLMRACFSLGVPFLETMGEADALLAYLAAGRTTQHTLHAMGADNDLLLIPNLIRFAPIRGKKCVSSAGLPVALGECVKAFLQHPAVLPHIAAARHAALLAATAAQTTPHLPLLAALTNSDFWEFDNASAMPQHFASPVGRYWRAFLASLRASASQVEKAFREVKVPLAFAVCHVAWELAAGRDSPLPHLQALARAEPLCSYAWDHLAGRLDPPEVSCRDPLALPGAAVLEPRYPGHSHPLSTGALLVALGVLAPVPGLGTSTPWPLAPLPAVPEGGSALGAPPWGAEGAAQAAAQRPLLPDLRASRVFLTSKRFCSGSSPAIPALEEALSSPYSPQTVGSFLPNFRDIRAPLRQLRRGLGVASPQLFEAAQQKCVCCSSRGAVGWEGSRAHTGLLSLRVASHLTHCPPHTYNTHARTHTHTGCPAQLALCAPLLQLASVCRRASSQRPCAPLASSREL